jgi:hypothetical protein
MQLMALYQGISHALKPRSSGTNCHNIKSRRALLGVMAGLRVLTRDTIFARDVKLERLGQYRLLKKCLHRWTGFERHDLSSCRKIYTTWTKQAFTGNGFQILG